MLDLSTFLEIVRESGRFTSTHPVFVARAPGRLDVMGGIADYSGSLVLQRPIAEATFAAAQRADALTLSVVSRSVDAAVPDRTFSMGLESLAPGGRPVPYGEARNLLRGPDRHWASYVVGTVLVLMRERGVPFRSGVNILIASSVPEGKGVASSAALEVASMQAIAAAAGLTLEPRDVALLCQKAENFVAGAPCGLMDQMTSAVGQADALMALLCQPAQLESPVPIPAELAFWGIDSGERHAVTGSDYTSVRTGAFMGFRIMAGEGDGEPGLGNGYLANVTPADFERKFLRLLPEEMSGADFLSRYSGTNDPVTSVDPQRVYPIRKPAAHPVYEHWRVRTFRNLLAGPQNKEQWTLLGELMYESHSSYSACGLGSRGTGRLVELARAAGPERGIFGARITGGGSGGTVAVLGHRDAAEVVAGIAGAYERETGGRPYVFSGSSDGAALFGTVQLNP
ncbi:MAG TPA: galactokinase family protein [Terriglobia bacterium]|nr:galactokinase family protein [Terriglobia bacterium]